MNLTKFHNCYPSKTITLALDIIKIILENIASTLLKKKLSEERVREIMHDVVEIERKFVCGGRGMMG